MLGPERLPSRGRDAGGHRSTVIGIYDMFAAVGRDWGVPDGGCGQESPRAGAVLVEAATAGPFRWRNGVWLRAETSLCQLPDARTSSTFPELFVASRRLRPVGRFKERNASGCASGMPRAPRSPRPVLAR